jgi:serine/threonine protein kinase
VPVQPLASGDPVQVAGYQLRGRLGTGGMGVVYLAVTAHGQPVALRVVRPGLGDDPAFRERFRQEVDAARRVGGLYTAQVLDADPEASPPWLATAYVPGPSLQEAVDASGPLPVPTALPLVIEVAEALKAIHAAGVVHRDLKPSNVLLASGGPRVIDFGIAGAGAAEATKTGARPGSPQCMAPEQANGGAVTPAADVWALGALACFAVTGRGPFSENGGEAAVWHRVIHGEPDLGGCPAELTGVIWACLTKDPSARPSLAQVTEWCQAEISARPAASAPASAPGLHDAVTPLPAALPAPSGPGRGFSRGAVIAVSAAAAVLVGLAAYGLVALAGHRGSSHNHLASGPSHRPRPTPSASPKPSPSSTLDQCLFGTWRQTLEQFPDTLDNVPVTFSGGAGVTQIFSAAGVNTLQYSNATYTTHENGNTWTQVDNGTATVNYATQDGMLLSSDLVQSGTSTLYENGSYSNSGPLSENIEPDRYLCSGNSLSLYAPNGDSIDLTRTS